MDGVGVLWRYLLRPLTLAFWHESAHFKVDPRTVRRFIHALVVNSQVNGSFYRRIPGVTQQTGMCWRQARD